MNFKNIQFSQINLKIIFVIILLPTLVLAQKIVFTSDDYKFNPEFTRGVFRDQSECEGAFVKVAEKIKDIFNADEINHSCVSDQAPLRARYRLEMSLQGLRTSQDSKKEMHPLEVHFLKMAPPLFIPTLRNQIANWLQAHEANLKLHFLLEVDSGVFVISRYRPILQSVQLNNKTFADCQANKVRMRDLFTRKQEFIFFPACDFSVLGREHDLKNTYPVSDRKLWEKKPTPYSVQKIPVEFGEATALNYENEEYSPVTGSRNVPIYGSYIFWLAGLNTSFDFVRIMESNSSGFDSLQDCEVGLNKQEPRSFCSYALQRGYFKYQRVSISF